MNETIKLGLRIAVGLFAFWVVWGLLHLGLAYFGYRDISKLGQWGDTFGALNALFSALGFSVLVATLIIQNQQIVDTRKDQNLERFEDYYFRILDLLRETRNDVRFRYSPEYRTHKGLDTAETYTGIQAFRAAWDEVAFLIKAHDRNITREQAGLIYQNEVHKRYESTFGPYFRLVYTALDRISKDKLLGADEKEQYGNLLRNQLTSYEAAIIGLNGLAPVSRDFARLIAEFRLLKHLPEGRRRRTLAQFYPQEVFSSRDQSVSAAGV